MLAGNAVKTWTFDFMAYLWAIHACNDCTTHGNKLFKVRNVTRLDLETSNVLAIALYPYRIHLTEYFPKNVQLLKSGSFVKMTSSWKRTDRWIHSVFITEPHMCCVGKINSISWTTWNTTVHTEPSDGQYSAACRYFYEGIVTGSVVNDSLIKYPDCGLFRDCHREKQYLCAKCVTIYAIFMEYFLDVVPGKRRQSAIKWMDFIFH